ncbi:hypothetical protein D3C73_1658080 [compost metagenome]
MPTITLANNLTLVSVGRYFIIRSSLPSLDIEVAAIEFALTEKAKNAMYIPTIIILLSKLFIKLET